MRNADHSTPVSTTETAREKLQELAEESVDFRLLNALLKHAPTSTGVDVIARHIIDASMTPNGLSELTKFYVTGLLLPSKPSAFGNSSCFISIMGG
jgi:hypothetical protein